MKSSTLFVYGAGSLLGSFVVPPLSLPLQAAALGLFVASELRCRREIKYIEPVKQRQYQAWLETLDHAFEHKAGAAQAYATNQLDWRYRQKNNQLNMGQSVDEKYLLLFTQGRPQSFQPEVQPQTVAVGAQIVHAPQSPEVVHPQAEPQAEPHYETFQPPQQPLQQPVHYAEPVRHVEPVHSATATAAKDASPMKQVSVEKVPPLKLESLMNTAFLLIYGCPGGGKTTLAKRIAKMRNANGHSVTVADPHGSKINWGSWKVIGSGRDYERLNTFLLDYDDDVTADYELYAAGKRNFGYSTLLADEFTQWADNCSNAPKFVKTICSDIRKLNRCAIIVSHADTLTGLGNAQGMRAAIDRAAVKLEVEAEIDIESGEYVATGYGWLKYPGKERVRVRIPYEPETPAENPKKEWDRFTPEYREFIKSDAWKAKRLERISLDTVNGKIICQLCGKPCTDADPPEVDHFKYPPRGASVQDFIDQPIDDLRTMHRSCHQLKTEQSRKNHAQTA